MGLEAAVSAVSPFRNDLHRIRQRVKRCGSLAVLHAIGSDIGETCPNSRLTAHLIHAIDRGLFAPAAKG
jgi:hypothetical protein